ncbi:Peptidase M12B ADAM/reprolysin [Trinorchestia longiramus]|nr:Peptidase M12B ADAM/reprolysin [Trinorchestia longiramus]
MLNKAQRLVLSVAVTTLAVATVDFGRSRAAGVERPLFPSTKFSAGIEVTDGSFYQFVVENLVGNELVVSLERDGNTIIPVVHDNRVNDTLGALSSENSRAFLYRYAAGELENIYLDFTNSSSLGGQHYLKKIVNASVEKFCATEETAQETENIHSQRPITDKREIVSYDVDILSVVDHTLFQKFGSVENLVNYLKIYWNMVDKRFKTLQEVQIKMRLKAIMYTTSPIVDTVLLDTRDSLEARVDTSKERFSEAIAGFRGTFDVAHLMTSRRLYTVKNGIKRYGAFGVSHTIFSACNVSSTAAYNSGIAEDDGNFGGVLHSAHVVAHNLGAHHDGSKHAETCIGGYIMSPVQLLNSSNNLLFSSCSASAMANMYFKRGAKCLHFSSKDHFEYPEVFPGSIESLTTQCVLKMRIPNAIPHWGIPASEHCVDLVCQFSALDADFTVHANTPALEGTQCDVNSYCHDGQCVIPTKGQ